MKLRHGIFALLVLLVLGVAHVATAQCVPDVNSPASINVPNVVAFVCPAGDGPRLASYGAALTFQVVDVTGLVCNMLGSNDFQVDGNPPSTVADGFQPPAIGWDVPAAGFQFLGNGTYTFNGALVAGGRTTGNGCIVKVRNVQINGGQPVALELTGPDLNGDGVVNLSDIAIFASFYFNVVYDWVIDYNGDGTENLSDVARLAQHVGHTFPPGYLIDPVD